METVRAGETLVRRDGVTVTVIGGEDGVDEAIDLLDRAEAEARAPLVDEAERSRLNALVHALEDGTEVSPHWHPLLARRGGEPSGYAGIVRPAGGDRIAQADLAPDRRGSSCDETVTALFAGLADVAQRHGAERLHVWIRHATDADEACAGSEGFEVERQLAVMGREIGPAPAHRDPTDLTIRPFVPGEDESAVVAVLREAYEGTPDGGWDRDRFDERRGYDWFDPDDLLVAEDEHGVAGLHWTKRRGDGLGEVYNLAVADRARGTGLGRALLGAGLRHLADRGCEEAILWVDRSNDAAVNLYRAAGFTERWVDVAFGRDLR